MGRRPSFLFALCAVAPSGAMEITWFGGSCVRLKGREGVVAADPYRSIVGVTVRHDIGGEAAAGRADDRTVGVGGDDPFASLEMDA